ncbi:PREDICTED: homeobox-leucine zipper protein HDG3-like [Camelina sativa]|uniref:Homeobox-leucine zipper protein HDG3-like n=2 Tax=Camelina sativa TaxID=90675 RepID=A0ABM0WDP1_CAMSA|nr:PREDICTED: homeobox-leucine zipper protein HDG3-like [Camelina sativa]XP_010469603.1 PREDICTED: homeobox-leucine zipper protein HDG3-like [Camelina sativa]
MVPVDNNGDNDNNENNNMNNIDGGLYNTNGGAGAGVEVGVGAGTGAEEIDSDNREEELGSDQSPPRKKKKYNRHSQYQIQEMEAFFKECPHPDDKQRRDLGRQLGLAPVQIKFWFQNKRTQNKNHQERCENTELRSLNSKLRSENERFREAVFLALCPKCGGKTAIGEMSFEEHHLRIVNARLNEEINELTALAVKFSSKSVISYPVMSPRPSNRPPTFEFGAGSSSESGGNFSRGITGTADADTPMVMELAIGAMEELLLMAQVGEPLWMGGVDGTSLALNLDEYARTFRKGLGPRLSGFRIEASRETALVAMNPTGVVEMLMQANLWSTMFVGMVGRAITHEKLLTDVAENFNGALQIMSAEYQVLSPLVSTRESYFVRYCKQQGENLWAVVDVSIDHLLPNTHMKCRRRPSGCLIQEIPNGYSKVTWVEHVEVNDREANQNIFKHFISSGQAFAANRWVATLERQCERIASIMTTDFQSVDSPDHLVLTEHGKTSILKLAERVARSFFVGLTSSMGTTFSGVGGDDIRMMTMKNINDPGRPPGVVFSAATSFWVPAPPKIVFDFLRDVDHRASWDVLCAGGVVHKISEIANGRDSRNCATLLRNEIPFEKKMMIIQETSTDPTASFVIYAPVDTESIEGVLSAGQDPDYVALLPSGFAILPDGMGDQPGGNGGGGSLLTVSFQMLVEGVDLGKLSITSVATVENLIRTTVLRIKALFPFQIATPSLGK